MSLRSVPLLCLLFLLSASACAATEPVESIRAAALAGVEEDGVTAEITLDAALRMPRCTVPLAAQRQGTGMVEVACPQQWRLYLPVKRRRSQRVLVLTRNVAAGEVVSADMLTQETRDMSRVVGAALGEPAAAIGQTTRRALAAGSVVTAAHLTPPKLVHRGDSVTLIARRGGIEVRMTGRALGEAGADQRISVTNPSSRRTLQGRVLAGGEVLVN